MAGVQYIRNAALTLPSGLAPVWKDKRAGLERDGGQVPDRHFIGVIAPGLRRVTRLERMFLRGRLPNVSGWQPWSTAAPQHTFAARRPG